MAAGAGAGAGAGSGAAPAPAPQPGAEGGTRSSLLKPAPVALALSLAALAFGGVVPQSDLAFAALFSFYLAASNRWRFADSRARLAGRPVEPLVAEAWVRKYAAAAGIGSILLPGALVCLSAWLSSSSASAPSAGAAAAAEATAGAVLRSAAPHLFLVVAQVLLEYVSAVRRWATLPRVLVPIGFNAFRLGALLAWAGAAWRLLEAAGSGGGGGGGWGGGWGALVVANAVLAGANVAFWTYNLFGFLLLFMLPRYLDKERC